MARPGSGARAAGDIVRTEFLPDPGAVAMRAAECIAQVAREAVTERGHCAMAISGGTTPWRALRALAEEDVPWDRVHLFQVDERAAPSGDPDRNFFQLKEALIDRIAIPSANVHPMPVEEENLDEGARRYEAILRQTAGTPPVLDLVQLGLGEDGHTASLFPDDAALQVIDAEVTVTGLQKGRRRMTLTFPARRRPVHPGGMGPKRPRRPPRRHGGHGRAITASIPGQSPAPKTGRQRPYTRRAHGI